MRYLDEITFVKTSGAHYDPDLGEQVPGEVNKVSVSANVTDGGDQVSIATFGDIRQRAVVIRLQPLFIAPDWDYIEFEGKTYKLVLERLPLYRHSLLVQEVAIDEQVNQD